MIHTSFSPPSFLAKLRSFLILQMSFQRVETAILADVTATRQFPTHKVLVLNIENQQPVVPEEDVMEAGGHMRIRVAVLETNLKKTSDDLANLKNEFADLKADRLLGQVCLSLDRLVASEVGKPGKTIRELVEERVDITQASRAPSGAPTGCLRR